MKTLRLREAGQSGQGQESVALDTESLSRVLDKSLIASEFTEDFVPGTAKMPEFPIEMPESSV